MFNIVTPALLKRECGNFQSRKMKCERGGVGVEEEILRRSVWRKKRKRRVNESVIGWEPYGYVDPSGFDCEKRNLEHKTFGVSFLACPSLYLLLRILLCAPTLPGKDNDFEITIMSYLKKRSLSLIIVGWK